MIVALLVPLSGLTFEFAAQAWDARRYPPIGQMIDVGGRRLHLYCVGQGSPTVVLEAGKGGYSLDWGRVLPEAGKVTRTCVYDRAGHAWSDATAGPRTVQQMAAELHTLLQNAREPGPFVLVAHSYGGLIARLYAHQYPQQVAGVVLVDSLSDAQLPDARADESVGPTNAPRIDSQRLMRHLGVIRLWKLWKGRDALPPPFDQLPPEFWKPRLAFTILPRALDEQTGEGMPWSESRKQILAIGEAGAQPLGNVPLLVLSSDPAGWARQSDGRLTQEEIQKITQARHAGQRELAALSSRGAHRVISDSGHFIQLEQPEAVIEAIREVVRASRGAPPS